MTAESLSKLTKPEAIIHEKGYSQAECDMLAFIRNQAEMMRAVNAESVGAVTLDNIAEMIENGQWLVASKFQN